MARLARVVIPGIRHHVTQRGTRRQDAFLRAYRPGAVPSARGGVCEGIRRHGPRVVPNMQPLVTRDDEIEKMVGNWTVFDSRIVEERRVGQRSLDDLVDGLVARGLKYQEAGRPEYARVALEVTLKHDPANRAALNNLAGIYFGHKEYDKAIEMSERILEHDPNDSHVALNAAKAYALKGDLAAAQKMARAVLQREPEHAEAKELLGRLQQAEKRRR
jgi:tetratricopeptide (TPR) repeat protein